MKSNQYYKEKYDTDIYPIEEDKEYLKKISRYKKRKKITWTVIAILLVLAVIAAALLYFFHTYKSYTVLDESEHSDSTYVGYEMIDDLQVRYTRDGISLFENKDQVIWSATYEMQNPQIDVNGEYVIVYEENVNKVYLFNLEMQLYTYETTMPIKKACVSEKGTVALLVEEDDKIHRIQYLDAEGEMIAEGRTFFSQKGYPLDMALSNDGYKLCISYYVIDGASTKTNLVFHSFDDIGDSSVDNIVTDDYYEETVTPTVIFMEDDALVAFGDNCILIYDDEKKPQLKEKIDINYEISSVFYDDKNFGTVANDENKNIITVYSKNGKQVSQTETTFEYTNVTMKKGRILLYNSTGWQVYLKNGLLKAEGSYSQEISQMIPAGYNTFMVVGNDKIEKIRLSD